MDALVMCGGRGTRLDADREKPLVLVAGEPMVDHVLRALAGSRVGTAYAAVSPHAPETRAHLRARADEGRSVAVVGTPGEGYVADLGIALADDRLSRPVLTVAADLPLLDATVVDRVLDAYDASGERGSLTVAVPAERKRGLGASVDATLDGESNEGDEDRDLAPAGVNVVGEGPDRTLVLDDDRLAVNVNRPEDLAVAERLAGT